MKKKLAIVVIIIVVGAVGIYIGSAWMARKVDKQILEEFKKVDESIASSNKKIDSANNLLFSSVEFMMNRDVIYSRLKASATREQASNLDLLRTGTDFYSHYLDSLQQSFKAVMTSDEDIAATKKFFETQGNGTQLLYWMKEMKGLYLSAAMSDSVKLLINSKALPVVGGKPVTEESVFVKEYFHQIPAVAGLTMLAHFKNIADECEMAILKDYSNLATIRITK